jgi:alanine-glyoxylate transaminase/(R)-3-amino-2-methylpropionate-pyruvate transaminase
MDCRDSRDVSAYQPPGITPKEITLMSAQSQPKLPSFDHQARPYSGPSAEDVLALRQRHVSPALFLYYKKPIMIVEGKMQYVFDDTGRRYLDVLGGIVTISVGHCHPYVTAKAREQIETLQHATTIYLHPNLAEYTAALAAKMPGELSVCYLVNSGSEANDLALLMARLYTGNYDMIALRNAYHGGNATAMGLTGESVWKFNFPQGFGIHHARNADPYRGPWGRDDPDAGAKYAADVQDLIIHGTPGRVAGFISESIQGLGGTVVYPEGYLQKTYEIVRAAGGVCIADEVQTGFGRMGSHYWGFETHGVTPDMVVMAKGIGNGFPMAAVVTTPKIANALTGSLHFNTYGGNPVACAIGKAVLEVIDQDELQKNSAAMGARIMEGLERLMGKHDIIGDVRGRGLMLGVELVKDRKSKEPAKDETAQVVETCKDLGLLIGKGGLYGNVLRIKPPMCLHKDDVDFLLQALDIAFARL